MLMTELHHLGTRCGECCKDELMSENSMKGFEFLAIGDRPNCQKEVAILIVSDVKQVDRWELQTST